MTDNTINAIRPYCDRYGDKYVELMDRCNVICLPAVPEEEALKFLDELKGEDE